MKNIHQIMGKAAHRANQVGCYILIELESPQRGENRELVWPVLYFKATLAAESECLREWKGKKSETEQSIRKK